MNPGNIDSGIRVLPQSQIGPAITNVLSNLAAIEKQKYIDEQQKMEKLNQITDVTLRAYFDQDKEQIFNKYKDFRGEVLKMWNKSGHNLSYQDQSKIRELKFDLENDIMASKEQRDVYKNSMVMYGTNPTKFEDQSALNIQEYAQASLQDRRNWDYAKKPLLIPLEIVPDKKIMDQIKPVTHIDSHGAKTVLEDATRVRVSSVLNSDIGIKWFNRNKDSKGWPNIKSAIDELTDFAISIAETKEARAVIPKKAEILTTYDRNPDTGEYTYLPNSLVMNKVNVQTVTTVSDLPNKLSTAAGDIEPLALSVVPVAKEEIGKRKSIFGLATLIKKGGLIPADKLKKLKPDQYEYKITISYKQDDKVFDELLGGAKETAMFEKLNSTSKGKKQLKYLIDIMDEFNNKKSVNEEEKKAKSQTELQKKQAEDQGIKKEKSQTEGEMKEGELNSYLRK